MSIPTVLARVAELERMLQPPAQAPVSAPPAFDAALKGAMQQGAPPFVATAGSPAAAPAGVPGAPGLFGPGTAAPAAAPTGPGTPAGQAIVNLVSKEVGVTEQPPGSNNAPRIAQYRQATVGSGVGPWCAYFTSWAAREAGVPIGDSGQGYGLVSDVWAWGKRTGKAIQNAAGVRPQPGDMIVWDGHIGFVESVGADGSVNTIEGNSSNMVARRRHGADGDGALGYVRLG